MPLNSCIKQRESLLYCRHHFAISVHSLHTGAACIAKRVFCTQGSYCFLASVARTKLWEHPAELQIPFLQSSRSHAGLQVCAAHHKVFSREQGNTGCGQETGNHRVCTGNREAGFAQERGKRTGCAQETGKQGLQVYSRGGAVSLEMGTFTGM